jgi:secondary thiamine-phosphate synthase enzyme
METLAPIATATGLAARVSFTSTHPTEFIDLTDRVAACAGRAALRHGVLNVQSLHTTLAIVVNEYEPLLLGDFVALLDRLAPADATYHHDDETARTVNVSPGERRNGHAHCRALFLPSSVCLNVVNGQLQLGRWQRVFAVELDGPRHRDVSVAAVHGAGR